jgi:hypothetical protein
MIGEAPKAVFDQILCRVMARTGPSPGQVLGGMQHRGAEHGKAQPAGNTPRSILVTPQRLEDVQQL